jgi:hypothetical protein
MRQRFVNVIHFSDFHHQAGTAYSEDIVVNALLRDLEFVRNTELRPDVCVFSGDLVYAADDLAYNDFRDKVIEPILRQLDLPKERIIFCPGNHDVHRKIAYTEQNFVDMFRKGEHSYFELTNAYRDGILDLYGEDAFRGYLDFVRSQSSTSLTHLDSIQSLYEIRDLDFKVISLNSALLSFAGIKDLPKDEGKLSLPEPLFMNGIGSIERFGPDLAVLHHPPSYLDEPTRALFRGAHLGTTRAVLFGHMHRPQPICSVDDLNPRIENQAGALFYDSHKDTGYKGYAIVCIDRDKNEFKVVHKRYYRDRLRFDLSLENFSEGTFYSSASAKDNFERNCPRFNKQALLKWSGDCQALQISEQLQRHEYRSGAVAIWIEPEFELSGNVTRVRPDIVLTRNPEIRGLYDLIAQPDNLLIEGRPESGKTSALLLWAKYRCATPGAYSRVPVYVPWVDLPKGGDVFLKLVRRHCSNLPSDFNVEDLLKRGAFEILIDDFTVNEASVDILMKAINLYQGCRFVVAYSSKALNEFGFASFVPEEVPFLAVRLRQLKRGQIREILRKRVQLAKAGEDALLNDILREARQNNLPLTPFTIASIVEIYSRDGELQFKNKANFVQRLIEVKLQKFALSEIKIGTFDYDNKMHCLSEMAAWMVQQDQYAPSEDDAIVWMKGYIDHHGFAISATKLLDEFKRASILQKTGDAIFFSYRVFLEYFIAKKMAENDEFRAYVLDDKVYLSYQNEIGLYFALTRKDGALLETVADRLDAIAATLSEHQFFSNDAGSELDAIPVTRDAATAAELEEYEKRVKSPQLSDEQRDALLDSETPKDVGDRQEVFRPNLDTPQSKWLYALLLYSSMVRSCDFLPATQKVKHLERALERWLQFLQFSLNIIPPLAEQGFFRIDGVSYRIPGLMDLKTKSERYRALQILMPIGITRMISYYMNTDKLRNQIRALDGKSESGFRSLLRLAMLLDLGYEGLPSDMRNLLDHMAKQSRYAEYIGLRRAADTYTHDRIRDEDQDAFRNVVAESIARLRASAPKNVSQEKARVLAQLSRNKLQIGALEKSDNF